MAWRKVIWLSVAVLALGPTPGLTLPCSCPREPCDDGMDMPYEQLRSTYPAEILRPVVSTGCYADSSPGLRQSMWLDDQDSYDLEKPPVISTRIITRTTDDYCDSTPPCGCPGQPPCPPKKICVTRRSLTPTVSTGCYTDSSPGLRQPMWLDDQDSYDLEKPPVISTRIITRTTDDYCDSTPPCGCPGQPPCPPKKICVTRRNMTPTPPPPPKSMLVRPPSIAITQPEPFKIQPNPVQPPQPEAILVRPPSLLIPSPSVVIFKPDPPKTFSTVGSAYVQPYRSALPTSNPFSRILPPPPIYAERRTISPQYHDIKPLCTADMTNLRSGSTKSSCGAPPVSSCA